MTPEPFEIHIDGALLEDLRGRLARTRFAPDFGNDDWRYGVPGGYLAELVEYWHTQYDWRSHEAAMNEFSHFRVELEGVPIHFLHQPGNGPAPIPLVLTHGWPWSFWDFRDVIGPLSDPGAHGGDPADAFDVVVPSLPGFGFSSPLTRTGVNLGFVAGLWDRLMRECLGYERYGAQGGDWGALVTATLGHRHADHLYGVHESLIGLLGFDYASVGPDAFGEGEEGWWDNVVAKSSTIGSHMAVHSSDPQTLAYGLHDSPAGLLAWMIERRRAWSDCDGDVESVFSRDDLLTLASLYWLTGTIGTSMRFYWENARAPFEPVHDREPACETPTGFAVFPRDVLLVPRRLAERHANIVHWSVMPRGGHFAPAEQPDLLVQDIRTFFRRGRS
jgi:pimeloyl-ACP methyl ester carboxylesterase